MTRHFAGHLLLEAERCTEEEIDSLRAVTVIDIVLAVQPVIQLEEECQVRLRHWTNNSAFVM